MTPARSEDLHEQTETPGHSLPLDTLAVIRFRYDWAAAAMPGRRVLEIGCGSGLGLGYFAQSADYFVAGDYSEENLRVCAARGQADGLVRFDAHRLPFADASFDTVVALAMVYYLQMDQLLAEVARVLRPGGHFLFCTSNKDVAGFVPGPHTVAYYTIPELARLLRGAGLEPRFEGAFPRAGGAGGAAVRGGLKNFAKAAIQALPGGDRLWQLLRRQAEGKHAILPDDVRGIPAPAQTMATLREDRRDCLHRVIYVTAAKS